MNAIEAILDARQKRAEALHDILFQAREHIRVTLTPESSTADREQYERLNTALYNLRGDPFDMHIRAALTAAPEGWRPISTAPKGRLIDIWLVDTGGGARWADCYYDQICDQWRASRPGGRLVSIPAKFVTHWREPPTAPLPPSEGAE